VTTSRATRAIRQRERVELVPHGVEVFQFENLALK